LDEGIPLLTRRRGDEHAIALALFLDAGHRHLDDEPVEALVAHDEVRAAAEDSDAEAAQTSPAHAGDDGRFVSRDQVEAGGTAELERGPRRERDALEDVDRRDHGAGMRSRPFMYPRRASGTSTEPSACWFCSRMATSVRPIARPEPLSVCAKRGLAFGSGR